MGMAKIVSISCVVCLLFPLGALAWWFGPNNYEDCILEKMKGQDKAMINTARKACERQFPFEKELYAYKDKIETSWNSDESNLYLRINKNIGEYAVTRYKASFSMQPCGAALGPSVYYSLTKTFVFAPGKDSASVRVENAGTYKCMRTDTVWGKLKK